ncbi:MAG TPA: hypothetical protein PKA41_04360 [Verrucomicrobiota bacterium]|nr:hypothetical protein [Verrucomicrobiota bacterium]
MIPILTILVACLGLISIVGGIIIFVLRRRGERIELSSDDMETQRILHKAFGKNRKWGAAGGTESEMHDQAGGDFGGGSGDGGGD